MPGPLLVIACGAIAKELVRIREMNGWDHIEYQCLPAELHNTPEKIPGAVLDKIEAQQENFERIFVAYADCGTGGLLDKALAGRGIERIPGAHCYEFYAGSESCLGLGHLCGHQYASVGGHAKFARRAAPMGTYVGI